MANSPSIPRPGGNPLPPAIAAIEFLLAQAKPAQPLEKMGRLRPRHMAHALQLALARSGYECEVVETVVTVILGDGYPNDEQVFALRSSAPVCLIDLHGNKDHAIMAAVGKTPPSEHNQDMRTRQLYPWGVVEMAAALDPVVAGCVCQAAALLQAHDLQTHTSLATSHPGRPRI